MKVRPRAPAPGRLAVHRPIQRGGGIPLIGRVALAVAVVAVAVGVLYVGAGGLGKVAGSIGSTLTGFVEGVTATASPAPTPVVINDAPSIVSPTEPYTNQESVDLVVTVPEALAGDPDHLIRIFLALEDQPSAPIDEVPLAASRTTIIPVALTKGINDFSVTLVGPNGESEPSPIVRYVLDTSKPGIKLTAPKDGATVNRKSITLEGRSQARATLIARNEANGSSIAGTAGTDGLFTLSLPLSSGSNAIRITATDPAGNVNESTLTVSRGSGKLRASLSASIYRIKRSALPEPVTLVVTVDDPDGKPLAGAEVVFTLSMHGVQTVTGTGTTDANGRATFETTVAKGATRGQGSAAVLVESGEFGKASDQTVITITK